MSSSKLLLADDSITIQKVVNLTFADEGIEVISVSDGNAAMEKFAEVSPDLVMADVNMPGLDGYRICELIKQDDETKQVPVVLLVGSFEPFDEEEAKRVGANDYLTKPFQSIRQLVEKVSDLLSESKVEKVAFAKPKESENGDGETVEADASSSVETIAPISEETPAEDTFDSAEMDDEMIQTDQIGSLPVGEAQRFESSDSDTSQSEAVQDQLRNPTYERPPEPATSPETQQLSSEEFNEITGGDSGAGKEEVVYEPAAEQETGEQTSVAVAEEPEIIVEEESDEEEEFVPTMIPTEQYFQPEPVAEDESAQVEEIEEEKGFAIGEDSSDTDVLMDETIRGFESSGDEEASQKETASAAESEEGDEKSQPGFIDKLRHIFRDKDEKKSLSITDQPEAVGGQTETDSAEQTAEVEEIPEAETASEPSAFFSEPEQMETAEAEQESEESEDIEHSQSETVSEIPHPEFLDADQTETAEPETLETADAEVESVEESQTAQEPEGASEPEISVPTPEVVEVQEETGGDEEIAVKEEISASEQEVVVAPVSEDKQEETQEATPAEEKAEEEKETKSTERRIIDLDEANLLEIAPGEKMSPIKSMVQSELREEKSDSGESMIVSEYARQSISLSSEAIDMIADRVADKIAEKVIRELSSEVVSDLADLVVEKMERKQLE